MLAHPQGTGSGAKTSPHGRSASERVLGAMLETRFCLMLGYL
jgi:hypothetical protein